MFLFNHFANHIEISSLTCNETVNHFNITIKIDYLVTLESNSRREITKSIWFICGFFSAFKYDFAFSISLHCLCNASPRPHLMIISLGCVWGFVNSIFINLLMVGISDSLLHSIGFFPNLNLSMSPRLKEPTWNVRGSQSISAVTCTLLVMFSIHSNITNKKVSFQ